MTTTIPEDLTDIMAQIAAISGEILIKPYDHLRIIGDPKEGLYFWLEGERNEFIFMAVTPGSKQRSDLLGLTIDQHGATTNGLVIRSSKIGDTLAEKHAAKIMKAEIASVLKDSGTAKLIELGEYIETQMKRTAVIGSVTSPKGHRPRQG